MVLESIPSHACTVRRAQRPRAAARRVGGHARSVGDAGEFLSGEFNEFLDSELITRTTCPPHVHQLNGVAERAIRKRPRTVQGARARKTSQARSGLHELVCEPSRYARRIQQAVSLQPAAHSVQTASCFRY